MKVAEEHRNCFGLEWYDDEQEAVERGRAIRRSGRTVNGGMFDGMPCDRAPEFDYVKDGVKLFAVRT